jgi:hypothetical protein
MTPTNTLGVRSQLPGDHEVEDQEYSEGNHKKEKEDGDVVDRMPSCLQAVGTDRDGGSVNVFCHREFCNGYHGKAREDSCQPNEGNDDYCPPFGAFVPCFQGATDRIESLKRNGQDRQDGCVSYTDFDEGHCFTC